MYTITMPIPAKHHPKTILQLGGILLLLLPILVFAKLSFEIKDGQPIGLDIAILTYLHRFANPTLDQIAKHLTDLGGPDVIVLATLVMALVLYVKRKTSAVTILLLGVVGAFIINVVLKLTFQRVRPSLWTPIITEKSFSFPSGHAMMSSALALSAMVILWPTRWRWPSIILGGLYILAIGLTRMYLGVHFPSDIVAGWTVSFIWVAIIFIGLSKAKPALPAPRSEAKPANLPTR
jgi:membrane-associated phospholipid phosphatase